MQRKIDEESGENANPYSDLGELMSVDLLSFAYQIASGMVTGNTCACIVLTS